MLSVVITAWNEEKNLPRVVSSVVELADEIVVVVDEASIDKTAEVAKKLGCTVYFHEHTGVVEPMRNYSIEKAKGDWILLLDADEEIPVFLARQIPGLISGAEGDYYRIPRKNLIFNKWVKSGHWWPDYVYRLFRKGAVSWDDVIHSVPFTRGAGRDLDPVEKNAIIHHHYDSVAQYIDRLNRYTDHQLIHLHSGFSTSDLISRPSREFLTQYFSRSGWKEGTHGLVLSLLQSYSEWALYLKLWEKQGFPASAFPPQKLRDELRKTNNDMKWWYYQSRIDSSLAVYRPFWKIIRKIITLIK